MHIPDAVDVYHEGYERHHDHHDGRQRVYQESNLEFQTSDTEPPVNVNRRRCSLGRNDLPEYKQAQDKGHQYACDRDPVSACTPDLPAKETCYQCTCQGRQYNYQTKRFH